LQSRKTEFTKALAAASEIGEEKFISKFDHWYTSVFPFSFKDEQI